MELPRPQVNEQTGPGQLTAVADELRAGQQVLQPPVPPGQAGPGQRDQALRWLAAQVDHYQVPRVVGIRPGPGQQVPAGLVVGPAAGLEQPPRPCPDPVTADDGEQAPVPGAELGIGRLAWPP